ncbi:cell division cycle-associated 7-like protein [Erpetoichthys calabaricus]|uniref:Cell division cycle associated 7 like n=1 Tax=Erpetoichthys calabaricus TaxID=27687 RepID=A0A8C4SJ31_ERPCA|nr:cell division cycle-associated 7-like protein [Erpetoichthys calabaricus]
MPVYTKLPKELVEIFETPSDEEEEFKGFRSSLEMETSSSEDSRDSFQSGELGKRNIHFQSKYITDELKKIFTEDTETEDEFEGFVEPSFELNKRMKSMSMHPNKGGEEDGFSSDEDQIATCKKRSSGLCVAFRFPLKKSSGKQTSLVKHELSDSESEKERSGVQRSRTKLGRCGPCSDSECEEGSSVVPGQSKALEKRAKNIKENKEMLAKLLAELNSVPGFFPLKSNTVTTPKQKKSPKKTFVEGQSGRRNPSRSARPPERFGVECFSVSPTKLMERLNSIGKRATLQKKLLEINDMENSRSRRRRSSKHGVSRSVTDITEEELENVAITSKDKLYDKINGSTCHQCRQKTIDTKTVCRNPDCWGVRGQFCGPCLRNRYGEDVRAALLDALWVCPPCRGICNCSFCRKRDGRCATGILIHMAKFYGYNNVKEYLESLQKQLSGGHELSE